MTDGLSSISVTSTGIGSIAGHRQHVRNDLGAVSCRDFLAALERDPEVADALTAALVDLPYAAFAWECRAIRTATLEAPIEMVAIDSPVLSRASADPEPFAERLINRSTIDMVHFAWFERPFAVIAVCGSRPLDRAGSYTRARGRRCLLTLPTGLRSDGR